MSTWKNVGMTYLKYADLCATHVRNALKEPMKTKSAAMSDMHIRIMQWEGGKRGKPGAHQLLPTCWQAVFLLVLLAPSLVACAVLERAHWARPAILQAAPVCGPDTRQLSPSPPFGGARKRSAPPAALTRCARPFAFAFAARRDRDQDGCSVILVATARSYFCGAHKCSCGGALRSARHILLSGAAAGVLDAPGTRFEMGRRCVLSRFPTHASCRSRRPSRGGKKHISEKSACGVTWPRGAPPARNPTGRPTKGMMGRPDQPTESRISMERRWPAGDFGALVATSVVVGLCVLLWARRWRDDDAARRGNASSAVTIVQLPTEAQPYKRLPAEGTFTRQNIPKGLLGKHNTKAGVYGKINVTCGVLQLETLDGALETVTITAGHHAIVAPRQYHTVTPLSDDVEMYIEFHAKPNDDVKGGGFG